MNLSRYEAWQLRRYLGSQLKSQTDQPFRSYIYLRNRIIYGDKLGPAFNPKSKKTVSEMLKGTSGKFNLIMNLPASGLSIAGAIGLGSVTAVYVNGD